MVTYDTLNEWANKHPEFSAAKRIAKKLNEKAMMDIGLRGMNGKISYGWQAAWIFAMKARHGMREDNPEEQEETDLEIRTE